MAGGELHRRRARRRRPPRGGRRLRSPGSGTRRAGMPRVQGYPKTRPIKSAVGVGAAVGTRTILRVGDSSDDSSERAGATVTPTMSTTRADESAASVTGRPGPTGVGDSSNDRRPSVTAGDSCAARAIVARGHAILGRDRRPRRGGRSAAGAVRGPGADGVLVEALREVQALEHELDAARDRGRRLAARRGRTSTARHAVELRQQLARTPSAGTSSPVWTTVPSSNAATIGAEPLGPARAPGTPRAPPPSRCARGSGPRGRRRASRSRSCRPSTTPARRGR